jgi:hypothetical protein
MSGIIASTAKKHVATTTIGHDRLAGLKPAGLGRRPADFRFTGLSCFAVG